MFTLVIRIIKFLFFLIHNFNLLTCEAKYFEKKHLKDKATGKSPISNNKDSSFCDSETNYNLKNVNKLNDFSYDSGSELSVKSSELPETVSQNGSSLSEVASTSSINETKYLENIQPDHEVNEVFKIIKNSLNEIEQDESAQKKMLIKLIGISSKSEYASIAKLNKIKEFLMENENTIYKRVNDLPDLISQQNVVDSISLSNKKFLEDMDSFKVNELNVPEHLKKNLECFDRDELVQLVAYQKHYLDFKESRIKDLENYIDNLVIKIIETEPSILMNSSSLLNESIL